MAYRQLFQVKERMMKRHKLRFVQGRIQKMNLEGANSGGPPEADDFSQMNGYIDVTSGILGGISPLNSPMDLCRLNLHDVSIVQNI